VPRISTILPFATRISWQAVMAKRLPP